jgi:hypothetical protein
LQAHTKDLLKHIEALAKRGYHKSQGSRSFWDFVIRGAAPWFKSIRESF